MKDKREILQRLLRGEIPLPELMASLKQGVVIGIMQDGVVRWADPSTGEEKSESRAAFEAIRGRYDKILAQIVSPCPPITNEDDIPEDIF